ncbi:MAG: ATP-grasp domain-containing protein, partial [Pseudomonadota bacterium]
GILKTRRMGYDGKGQVRLGQGDDPQTAFKACGGVPAILEEFVEFDCEISQIAMRGQGGEVSFFDPPHNLHKDGILHQSRVPANISLEVSEEARHLTASILEELDYIGVLTVEFFWSSRKGLMANEIAPRVHNSGHWTVEACVSSQFEQHIRAIAGWPLGSSARHSNAIMTNLIGEDVKGWSDLIKNPHIALTLYGKEEARQGRKMGHTVETSPL